MYEVEGRLAPFVGLANALIASCSVLGLPYLFAIVVALILRERYNPTHYQLCRIRHRDRGS